MNKGLPHIDFKKTLLPNGMVVIVIPKPDTGLVAVNLLYRTGSRDESPDRTGLAHLMEHLMFSGTSKYPKFDLPISRVGGINNAFTNQDITNYYMVLPGNHLSLAFELESDRMFNLNLTDERVNGEKRVVVEEFKQRYLNQPYGDLSHLLYNAAYRIHPYRWPAIGLTPEHIESVTTNEVKAFYQIHYQPSNLIMTVAGDVDYAEVMGMVHTFFSPLSSEINHSAVLPAEPLKGRHQQLTVHRDVPASVLLMAFPVPGVNDQDYHAFGFLADILGSGIISRLYDQLVRRKQIFTRISASISNDIDPGLFKITGVLRDDSVPEHASAEITRVLNQFILEGPTRAEMKSVMNGMHTSTLLRRQSVANLAMETAQAEMEGDAAKINEVFLRCSEVNEDTLTRLARHYLVEDNRIEIHYLRKG